MATYGLTRPVADARRALAAALVAAVGVATGCRTPEPSPEAAPVVEAPAAPALPVPPPARFEPSTDEQRQLLAVGRSALRRGDLDTAVTALLTLRRTAEAGEARATGALLLAQIYRQQGNVEASAEVIAWLRTAAPTTGELEFVAAMTLLDAGDRLSALEALQRAVAVSPDYLRPYVTLAALHLELEQPDEADYVLVELERAALRVGHALDEAPDAETRIKLLRDMQIGVPHPYVSRAARRALGDDDHTVVAVALDVLAAAGTSEARPALLALAASQSPLAGRAAEVAALVEARQ